MSGGTRSSPMNDPALETRPIAADVKLLYAARGIRGFGDGFAVIILPAYLTAIGYSPFQIGIVATAALSLSTPTPCIRANRCLFASCT